MDDWKIFQLLQQNGGTITIEHDETGQRRTTVALNGRRQMNESGEHVAELNLSVRATHALEVMNVQTVDQLCQMSPDDLLQIPNLGITTLNEIRMALEDRGLHLRDEKPVPAARTTDG